MAAAATPCRGKPVLATAASLAVLACALAALTPSTAVAQFSFPGCTDLQPSEFSKTELFNRNGTLGAVGDANLSEPVAFDLNPIRMGDSVVRVDAYFVQRKGAVKYYNSATNTVTQIGTIPVAAEVTHPTQASDNGLMGIVLDPGFATNRWVYLWYVPPRVGNNNYRGRLSRFTLTGDNQLDMASERNLIDEELSDRHQWHAGGPMQFDRHGDLWVTLGNNSNDHDGGSPYSQFSRSSRSTSEEWGASSTASLRGGVFRITPDTSDPRGYTIPAGNFGEYWADYFQTQGNAARAAEYRDTSKVRPEIYVKGERSNHSIAVHPRHRWIGWGTVNFETNRDELNLITNPAFTGYPYFHGQADNPNTTRTAGQQQVLGYLVDSLNPRNASPFNTGVEYLPPVKWPVRAFNSGVVPNVVIGGPFYSYDRNLKSSRKFPPHLHNHWIAFGHSNNNAHLHTIDSIAVTIAASQRVDAGSNRLFTNVGTLRNVIQAKYGPEGALYILFYGSSANYNHNNNPGLVRIDYTGSCHLPPVSLRPDMRTNPDQLAVQLRAGGILVRERGAHVVTLHALSGARIGQRSGDGVRRYALADLNGGARLESGTYVVTVRTERGRFVRQVTVL